MTEETLHPKRHIPLESVQNLRDLGGYSTMDGHITCWRQYARCAGMSALTETDQQRMIDYGIRAVVDLRTQREIGKSPNPFAGSQDVVYHHFDLLGDRMDDFTSSKSCLTQADKLAESYRTILARCEGMIGEIMGALADQGDHVSLFHCGAGKDRTGLIAALLLGVAGAPHETIAADYGLTSLYLKDPNRDHDNPDPMFIPEEARASRDPGLAPLPVYMFSCLPKTMLLVLAFMDENYGGVEGYVRKIGLMDGQIDRLKTKFVE